MKAPTERLLPIGHEQTISKPSVVARMIELLHKPKHRLGKVLEIGTGCGYQAAVLSLLADEVYSIERIRSFHDMARAKLRPFRINNLLLIYGDGILGLPQAAPFDGIILAAAGLGIPVLYWTSYRLAVAWWLQLPKMTKSSTCHGGENEFSALSKNRAGRSLFCPLTIRGSMSFMKNSTIQKPI